MGTYVENEQYELVPDPSHPDAWRVRFLEGEFPETVIQYGAIRIDNKNEDDPMLRFSFDLISSPDPDLTVDDIFLQEEAANVLTAIIESAIQNDELRMKDVE